MVVKDQGLGVLKFVDLTGWALLDEVHNELFHTWPMEQHFYSMVSGPVTRVATKFKAM